MEDLNVFSGNVWNVEDDTAVRHSKIFELWVDLQNVVLNPCQTKTVGKSRSYLFCKDGSSCTSNQESMVFECSFLRKISSYWVRLYGWGFMKALHLTLHAKVRTSELKKIFTEPPSSHSCGSCNNLVTGEHGSTQLFADMAGKPIPYIDQWSVHDQAWYIHYCLFSTGSIW